MSDVGAPADVIGTILMASVAVLNTKIAGFELYQLRSVHSARVMSKVPEITIRLRLRKCDLKLFAGAGTICTWKALGRTW